ncbi:helix-turn-helix domain-containing protein [Paenibacillus cymbidii]|uniref:helix-turn-helix domain-containing protein n=1 Tax=Paenibacillus cymbidii TaxID=1639034 RepID=UPI0010821889|nr:helix-turn-helix domain-containing protein [Paenibacillus cymbidii]
MLRTMLHRRKSVILTWTLSYAAVLLLPLAISLFVYFVSSRTLESEIHQANRSLLSQVREVADGYFQSMERLSFEMTWNVRIQDLLYSGKYSSYPEEYPYDLFVISKDMSRYKDAYKSVDLFYLYLKKDNTVVMPTLVREGQYAFNLLHKVPGFSYEAWQEIVRLDDFKGYLPMTRITEDGKQRATIAFITSYKPDKETSPAVNVVMIDASRIVGAIENVELFSKGHVFIVDESRHVLVSNNGADAAAARIPYEQMTDPSGSDYMTVDGKKYELLYLKSATSPSLTYVSMIPSGLYWQKAKLVRNLTMICSAISLLGGALIALFFLRKNYNPVRRLVQALSGKSGIGYGKETDEFQFIQNAYDNTAAKMDTVLLQMEQQRHALRSNFIARLLKGRFDERIPIDESLATFDMHFDSDDFAVMLLYLESGDEFYSRVETTAPVDKRKLLQFIVTNVMEELASRHHLGYVAEMDDTFACLINLRGTESPEDRAAELRHIAQEANRFLTDHYRLVFTFSLSGIHRDASRIPAAYAEALDAMEYKLVMGAKDVFSFEDVRRQTAADNEPGFYYPLQVEQQLINAMKIGDYDKGKATLDGIFEQNFHRPAVSIAYARCLMVNLASTMIKTVGEIGSVQDSFLVQHPKRIERFLACRTIQEMQEQLTSLLGTVCEYTAERRKQHMQESKAQAMDKRIRAIVELIDRTYMNVNLNISLIGDHFDMKPAYLSKLFKDHTGEGLLDHINRTRIAHAKRLMAASHRNVNELYAEVGFNDVNAFIRMFKKYEGITPGKFRETVSDS